MSYHEKQCYPLIWTFTYGVLFFGVPHEGSALAGWGTIAFRLAQLGTGRLGNESFLRSIEPSSAYSLKLRYRFRPLHDAFRFFSICETLEETGRGPLSGIVRPPQLHPSSISLLLVLKIMAEKKDWYRQLSTLTASRGTG